MQYSIPHNQKPSVHALVSEITPRSSSSAATTAAAAPSPWLLEAVAMAQYTRQVDLCRSAVHADGLNTGMPLTMHC